MGCICFFNWFKHVLSDKIKPMGKNCCKKKKVIKNDATKT